MKQRKKKKKKKEWRKNPPQSLATECLLRGLTERTQSNTNVYSIFTQVLHWLLGNTEIWPKHWANEAESATRTLQDGAPFWGQEQVRPGAETGLPARGLHYYQKGTLTYIISFYSHYVLVSGEVADNTLGNTRQWKLETSQVTHLAGWKIIVACCHRSYKPVFLIRVSFVSFLSTPNCLFTVMVGNRGNNKICYYKNIDMIVSL